MTWGYDEVETGASRDQQRLFGDYADKPMKSSTGPASELAAAAGWCPQIKLPFWNPDDEKQWQVSIFLQRVV